MNDYRNDSAAEKNFLRSRPVKNEPSFQINDRVTISLDRDLADELGNFILDRECPNTALLALAHKLVGE